MTTASPEFEPSPPVEIEAERQHGYEVAILHQLLEQAGRGELVGFAFSNALSRLANCNIEHRLSRADFDRLVGALARAETAAAEHLPNWVQREDIAKGCQGAAERIEHWARSAHQRRRRSTYLVDVAASDAKAFWFILRYFDEKEAQRFRNAERRCELDAELREIERRDQAA